MVNDSISDFIIQIKNAGAIKKAVISVPYSKLKFAVGKKLQEAGYVKSVTKHGKKTKKTVDVELLFNEKTGKARIEGVKRVSKPGCRVYTNVTGINPVKYGHGSLILSTPKGILTDKEARKEKVGGEALFKIW